MHNARRYDIDALRVLLFVLLILYHVGMLYVAEWNWHIKSSYQSEGLQYLMLLVNRWRMPLLFLISGLAFNFLRRDCTAWTLIRSRSRRVLLPLVFGVLAIVPIQPYCQGVANHLVEPGFSAFLVRYYSFQPWPKDAFDGWQYGFTWNHLWYLVYLWVYTLVLVALLPALESPAGRTIRRAVIGLRGGWLLLLPALPKFLALSLLGDRYPGTNDLIHDWYQHALYFSYFLLGYWIATDDGIWQALRALRHRALALAVLNWLAYVLIIKHLLNDDSAGWALLGTRFLSGLNTWLWIATVLGWSAALLNRPFRWLPYANEAVLPWYILHQSLIVAIAFVLMPLRVGPMLEPLAVIAGTIAGCALLYEYLIRRSAVLRLLFGLKPRPEAAKRINPSPVPAFPLSSDHD